MNLKALIYCTKEKPYLQVNPYDLTNSTFRICNDSFKKLNGKILAECDFEVEKIDFASERFFKNDIEKYNLEVKKHNELLKRSCLTAIQMVHYLDKEALGETNLKGYAIHIKNLHTFDKPKELSDYYKTFERTCGVINGIPYFMDDCDVLKKAPQNMMYVYDKDGVKYVLISVHPEYVVSILNGFKDVEVRRVVLKEMK